MPFTSIIQFYFYSQTSKNLEHLKYMYVRNVCCEDEEMIVAVNAIYAIA